MPPLDGVLNHSTSSIGSTEESVSNPNPSGNNSAFTSRNCSDRAFPCPDQSRKRRRKSVSFNPTVLVKETLHSRDYTREEYKAYWMTREDFELVDVSLQASIRHLERGVAEREEADICYRGVYEKTKTAIERYSTDRRQLLEAVFQEQARQNKLKISDTDLLGLICGVETFESQRAGLERALKDECDVQKYLSSTTRRITD